MNNPRGALGAQKSPVRRKAFERPGLTEDEIEEIIPIKSEPVPSHESLGQAVTQVDVNPPGGYDENYEEYTAYDEANYTVDATEGNKGEVSFNSVGSLCFV